MARAVFVAAPGMRGRAQGCVAVPGDAWQCLDANAETRGLTLGRAAVG